MSLTSSLKTGESDRTEGGSSLFHLAGESGLRWGRPVVRIPHPAAHRDNWR